VHLLLMGFPGIDQYQQLSHQLGIENHVTMPGRIPYIDAPRHLALGDVAVAPKLSTTEGSGKLLNYMAVGLPTVAFATPVAQEYLGREGFFAVPRDVDDLADKLQIALSQIPLKLDSHGVQERLRQRAVRFFSWDQAGHRIVSIYQTLLTATEVSSVSQIDQPAVRTKRPKSVI
jgi:glycosyltransferase involved in cell wall biosynthesis